MNYKSAMAAARQGQLITINGHILALLDGAQLTHDSIEGPMRLRTMLYALSAGLATPYTPTSLDKDSTLWDIVDDRGVEADEPMEGRAILSVRGDPMMLNLAHSTLEASKRVEVESYRVVGDGEMEFFLRGIDLPKPVSGAPTERVILVVHANENALVTEAFLSGPTARYVL